MDVEHVSINDIEFDVACGPRTKEVCLRHEALHVAAAFMTGQCVQAWICLREVPGGYRGRAWHDSDYISGWSETPRLKYAIMMLAPEIDEASSPVSGTDVGNIVGNLALDAVDEARDFLREHKEALVCEAEKIVRDLPNEMELDHWYGISHSGVE